MIYMIFYFLCLLSSSMFTFLQHPMSMGLTLLIQTLLTCLMSGILMKTFWFSYILFLIFLGGLLILFIYVTSLASNEMFSFSMKMFMVILWTFLIFMFMMNFIDKMILLTYMKNYENYSIMLQKTFLSENNLIMNKLYNFPINLISLLLMIYLFLTLIAIVKISNNLEGPLRPNTKF